MTLSTSSGSVKVRDAHNVEKQQHTPSDVKMSLDCYTPVLTDEDAGVKLEAALLTHIGLLLINIICG